MAIAEFWPNLVARALCVSSALLVRIRLPHESRGDSPLACLMRANTRVLCVGYFCMVAMVCRSHVFFIKLLWA